MHAAATAHRSLEDRVRERLSDLERLGLRRRLEVPSGVDLCSNDYLGFARHARIRKRFARAAEPAGITPA